MAEILERLVDRSQIRTVTLRSESYPPAVRYVVGEATEYEIALSLKAGSYLSHGTAVFLHGLTDQIPKTIYVNAEQSPKPEPGGELTQEKLDAAFSRPQRMSNYSFTFGRTRVVALSGKNTGRLEVGTIEAPQGENLPATKVERTLIDIVVRPAYSGGIFQVLEAYRSARERRP